MSKRLDYNKIAPAGVKALGGVYGYVMQSKLPAVLVDLVYLRVSQINNCAYCLDMHTHDLLKKGQKIEKLAFVPAWAAAGPLFGAGAVRGQPHGPSTAHACARDVRDRDGQLRRRRHPSRGR